MCWSCLGSNQQQQSSTTTAFDSTCDSLALLHLPELPVTCICTRIKNRDWNQGNQRGTKLILNLEFPQLSWGRQAQDQKRINHPPLWPGFIINTNWVLALSLHSCSGKTVAVDCRFRLKSGWCFDEALQLGLELSFTDEWHKLQMINFDSLFFSNTRA